MAREASGFPSFATGVKRRIVPMRSIGEDLLQVELVQSSFSSEDLRSAWPCVGSKRPKAASLGLRVFRRQGDAVSAAVAGKPVAAFSPRAWRRTWRDPPVSAVRWRFAPAGSAPLQAMRHSRRRAAHARKHFDLADLCHYRLRDRDGIGPVMGYFMISTNCRRRLWAKVSAWRTRARRAQRSPEGRRSLASCPSVSLTA